MKTIVANLIWQYLCGSGDHPLRYRDVRGFAFITAMFGSYILQSKHLINDHQYSHEFTLIYSHVLMVIAILSLTAVLDYLTDQEVLRTVLWLSLFLSTITYYFGLLANGVYNHRRPFTMQNFLLTIITLVLGTGAFLLRASNPELIICLALVAGIVWANPNEKS
ncbi:hypothetical protein [uncultured Limosilactobacillus sp.]|uniref:hypothetical protein n=1 Tax=uncultured Limosilactobacillus sp. TaxID=2837629 RepID=UPI00259456A8|nr:hypothetical protein [uncultured Limosilactobacillus sp.]